MDLKDKLKYVEMHVKSISQHTDVDATVRKAALDRIAEMAHQEMGVIDEEVRLQIEQMSD